jgi:hypothetical protein
METEKLTPDLARKINDQFDKLVTPTMKYLSDISDNQEESYFFLVVLMGNVYKWLNCFCKTYDVDYDLTMEGIIEGTKEWEKDQKNKRGLN